MNKEIGSAEWNNELFLKHPTPYSGIAGKIEYKRAKRIASIINHNGFSKNANILEIGCEQGNLLDYLIKKFPANNYYGSDISSEALKNAKIKLDNNITLIQNDITKNINLELPKLDVLICTEVLEHIPDYKTSIKNISKLVDKDTLVIITVPLEKHKNNIKSFLQKIGLFNLLFKGIEEGLSEWHVNDFSKEEITLELEKYFEVKSYELMLLLHQILVLKKK